MFYNIILYYKILYKEPLMIKKFLIFTLLFLSSLEAAIINTDKDIYTNNEHIAVVFEKLRGESDDWIAIYPENSASDDFGQIVQWSLTNGQVNGNMSFAPLQAGIYDIRIFYGGNLVPVVSKQITVNNDNGGGNEPSIETSKMVYTHLENIVANFDNASDQASNWMGIYPAASNNDWENVVVWSWLSRESSGSIEFQPLPIGEYEVRLFFNNSFELEAKYAFSVQGPEPEVPTIQTRKESYDPYELIHVDFEHLRGVQGDWIGLFEVGANNDKASAIDWKETGVLLNGERSFNGLTAGNYEARLFFGNQVEKVVAFTVNNQAVERVLYDDFEDGIDPRWTKHFGRDMVLLNVGAIDQAVGHTGRQVQVAGQHSLRTYNSDGLPQSSGYLFDFESPEKKFKFLNIDMKIGVSSHRFAFGVKVKTKFGDRRIEFASWLNHTLPSGQQIIRGPYGNVLEGHRQAFTQDNYLFVHPAPSDYYVGTSSIGGGQNMFVNYKINIEEILRVMEPDNELYEITLFTTSGGDYDNLALSTQ